MPYDKPKPSPAESDTYDAEGTRHVSMKPMVIAPPAQRPDPAQLAKLADALMAAFKGGAAAPATLGSGAAHASSPQADQMIAAARGGAAAPPTLGSQAAPPAPPPAAGMADKLLNSAQNAASAPAATAGAIDPEADRAMFEELMKMYAPRGR